MPTHRVLPGSFCLRAGDRLRWKREHEWLASELHVALGHEGRGRRADLRKGRQNERLFTQFISRSVDLPAEMNLSGQTV